MRYFMYAAAEMPDGGEGGGGYESNDSLVVRRARVGWGFPSDFGRRICLWEICADLSKRNPEYTHIYGLFVCDP